MKKTTAILLSLILVIVAGCVLFACTDEGDPTIEKVEIATTTYAIGDTYNSSDAQVILYMSDKNEKTATENLVFVGDGKDVLKLDDENKFTQKGEFDIKVYSLEERDDMLLGTWHIKVV